MKVETIMSKEVVTITPEATAADAIRVMNENGLRYLPVVESGSLVGVVTDGDILFRLYLHGHQPGERKVEEIMTRDPLSTTPDTDELDAIRLMGENKIRRLPVVEKDKLVGILSITDIESRLAHSE